MFENLKPKRASVVAIVLTIIMAASTIMSGISVVNAHTPPWDIPTYCYVNASPNPIGSGQQLVIVYWINSYPPTAQGAYGDRWTFEIDITKPDSTKVTMGPYNSDPVGGGYLLYTPDQIGTYTIVARFLGHKLTGLPLYPGQTIDQISGAAYVNDTFLPSTSSPYEVTVQEKQIENWPEAPLPTGFWTRPINNLNRDWWPLAGNWLAGAAQQNGPTTRFAYGKGPESAHIMWAKPLLDGGTMDARFGNVGYYTGLSYESYWSPPIILNGRIYYNVRTPPRYGWYATDLYTGETLFFQNTTGPIVLGGATYNSTLGDDYVQRSDALRTDTSGAIQVGQLSFGQILNYDSPNQHGGFPYLWSTSGPDTNTWMMFDAFTGNYICSIANVSSGTEVYGKDGSILLYNLVGPTSARTRLTIWNSTHAIQEGIPWLRNWYWCWRPILNHTYDGRNGFSLNVTIPPVAGSIYAIREGEYIIGGTSGKNNGTYTEKGHLWALSLEKGKEGTLLWNITFTPPEGASDLVYPAGAGVSGPYVYPEDDVFLFSQRVTMEWWGYSLKTGEQIWGPTEPEVSFNYYGMSRNVYQGKLITWGYGGELRAYNISTGKILWKYVAEGIGYESAYGNYPISGAVIADGKIYIHSTEHSPSMPLYRGPNLRCIDLNTGEELWKISHWGSSPAIADGFLVDLNLYDNRIYVYGKGPSATTVTAPDAAQPLGTPILLKGTFTDQSSGAKGTPAISDESMQAWMEYLYMQQAIPENATGVSVTLDAINPNGEFIHIGTTTTNMDGKYGFLWEPTLEGVYEIIATFEGSKSYYSSYSTTHVAVGPAHASGSPQPTTSPTSPTTSPVTSPTAPAVTSSVPASPTAAPEPGSDSSLATYIAVAAVAIIVAVIVVALLLKRRAH